MKDGRIGWESHGGWKMTGGVDCLVSEVGDLWAAGVPRRKESRLGLAVSAALQASPAPQQVPAAG